MFASFMLALVVIALMLFSPQFYAMCKKLKKPEPKPVDDGHVHCYSNWTTTKDEVQSVSCGGNTQSKFRVIQQERTCGLCGWKDVDIKKIVTASVEWAK